jgi:hypothetical protein
MIKLRFYYYGKKTLHYYTRVRLLHHRQAANPNTLDETAVNRDVIAKHVNKIRFLFQ